MKKTVKRNMTIDFIKIGAMISVVVLHTSSLFIDPKLKLPVVLITLFRFGVPAFLMITGYLYLNLDIDFKLKKKMIALLKTVILSTLLFAIPPILAIIFRGGPIHLFAILSFGYHLWYLNLLIVVFLALPILKQINRNAQMMKYLTILSIVFGLILPELIYLAKNPELALYMQKFHLDFFRNMLILVLLGKYLFKLLNSRIVIVSGFLATGFLVIYTLRLDPVITDYSKIHFFGNVNILLILSVFFVLKLLVMVYQQLQNQHQLQHWVSFLAPHSLRIYILHVIPMYVFFLVLQKLRLVAHTEVGVGLQILLITILAILISTIVSVLLNQTDQTRTLFSLAS